MASAAASSSSSSEPTTRFAHLLQPIRDLSKVWKIEIADELERYIEEVSQLVITDPEDGITKMNFAEAALLIQGSTAIYSRKVELLYQLVYQALDLLSLDKKDGSHGKKGKAVQSGLWAPIPETDELLTIDHLIKEGRNITLDHTAPEQRQAMQRRVPLFLMPRDQADRRKKEFRISSCTVHHTGVYLLQESDAKLLDEIMSKDDSMQGGHIAAPLVPAPPQEVQDLDCRLQELLREIPGENATGPPDAELPPTELEPEGQVVKAPEEETSAPMSVPMAGSMGVPGDVPGTELRKPLQPPVDPWALLDEHQAGGHDLPLEVGKTSKRFNAKKLEMNAQSLPDAGDRGALSDEALWSGNSVANLAPLLAAGHPVEALFCTVAGNMKSGGRYETQKAAFSAAWLEFEDLFASAMGKRRTMKMQVKGRGVGAAMGGMAGHEGSDVEASDDEDGRAAAPMSPLKPQDMNLGAPDFASEPELTEEQLRREEQLREVARLETMIQDAQQKYESTVRQHLQMLQKDSVDSDNRKFPQLYANVRRWQDQLEPVLKEFESRPEFDIHGYSTKFLAKMSEIQKSNEVVERAIPFSRLVHGQPRWEVCRRFLTCLILTNHGNTDITFSNEDERQNHFGIKLLKAEKKMISLDGDQPAPLPAPTKLRKASATAVHEDGGAGDAAPGAKKRARKGARA